MMVRKDPPLPASEVVSKGKKRRRRAGNRAGKRRSRKTVVAVAAVASLPFEKHPSPVKCAVHAFLMRYQSALRKVPAHLPPRVHAGPPSKRVKRVSWSHDESGCLSGAGDPAVLAVGPARRALTYTREQLLRLRNSPLVKRPLDLQLAGCDALALVLKKRSDSPNEDERGGRGDAPNENHKGVYGRERERRSADPRERVRKESEPSSGIVLSPQRRSFTSGCGAPAAAAPPPHVARTRPDSPLSTPAAPPVAKPDPAGRRIGSGRIMVRDVPAGSWEEGEYRPSEPYRPPRADHRPNGDRFERRTFTRDSYSSDMKREREDRFNNEKQRDREDNRRSGGRYSQRRYEKEDEPEWFSGGPTSQLETIELRGFDDPPKKNGTNKESEKWNNSGGARSPGGERERNERSERAERNERSERPERWRSESVSEPAPAHDDTNDTSNEKDSGVESKPEEPAGAGAAPDFSLDEFLKFDALPLPDVLTNGGGESEGGSRFSRWFRRESPTHERHYERLLHNMVDELEPCERAAEPAHVFAPISPGGARPPPSLLDLLRRANSDARPEMNAHAGGKIHSLEELEARLRPPAAPLPDHDLSAFKRLLAQVSGGHAVPAAAEPARAPPPMSLLQMLSKSMEQQQAPRPPHIPPELLYKLLQVQQHQQQQAELPPPAPPAPAPPAPCAADRDLLQRPEAQAIIHGLKAGEITVQNLMQQLGNPGLQSRHREVLLTILRLHQQQRQQQPGGSPLPGAGAHLAVPRRQPPRLSPLPHPGVPARIPSPRELAAHTQSIMQSALIKKKLEEQRENYRRRHDAPCKTPISFTPTSVLRKMTADKECEAPSPKQQWAAPPKLPQGRPIVKGNQSGAAPPMGYAPSPADYQHHYQQQQMSGSVRQFLHSQQRQQVPNSINHMNNMNNMSSMGGLGAGGAGGAGAGGATLHQLLVQSHQRSLNELGGAVGSACGGGDNQLARWFSPELLARASAGKLPSVHVPNALALEDLERHHQPAPKLRN